MSHINPDLSVRRTDDTCFLFRVICNDPNSTEPMRVCARRAETDSCARSASRALRALNTAHQGTESSMWRGFTFSAR